MNIRFLENEYWYGGVVHIGARLPISRYDDIWIRLVGGVMASDQYSPLLLSSRGRILYSERAFDAHFANGVIEIDDSFRVELMTAGETLRDASLEAARRYYPLDGRMPNPRFFETPQYNTWIELMYNQNQKQILEYAHTLLDGGMAPGVLMIDEGWAPDYGIYEFDSAKFDDPKGMVDELHALGFSVMLWVTPMISPDSGCFRELRNTELLVRDGQGKIAIREWWNGYSAVLDFTNPETCAWYRAKLENLMQKYGIDGFKFDSGDTYLYRPDDTIAQATEPNGQTRAFNLFCESFGFNELRNVWNAGGAALVCRLQDKEPHWSVNGIASLIPNMLTQGILGYYYGCPDMVGGGSYGFFGEGYKTDEELYLRWLAASLLCPMMQFSISPRRVLSDEAFAAAGRLVSIRQEYSAMILSLAEAAGKTGEPIMRYMEYEFPGQGFEAVTDQFMLGRDILVAPILAPGAREREVKLPIGEWQARDGRRYEGGGSVALSAAPDELIVLSRIS